MKYEKIIAAEDVSLHPLQQHPYFAAALSGMGRPMVRLKLPGHGTALVMQRRLWPSHKSLRVASRGPHWHLPPAEDTQWEAFVKMRARGVQIVNAETTPAHIIRSAGYRQIVTPATVGVIDMRGTRADQEMRMTAKWRNGLRKAEHAGLTINAQSFDKSLHHWILAADAAQQVARGFRAIPAALTQSYAIMNKDAVLVVTAYDGDAPVAAMVFLRHGESATYHIGWTSPAGRLCNAHNLCLSTGMDVLSDAGYALLDLGQIDTENKPGLARFKLGSGAVPRRLGGTWMAVPWIRPRLLV